MFAFELANELGTLHQALAAFAERSINLRSLILPPSRTRLRYRFSGEIDRVDQLRMRSALTAIVGDSRIFGVYEIPAVMSCPYGINAESVGRRIRWCAVEFTTLDDADIESKLEPVVAT